jgi:hypothetical protein
MSLDAKLLRAASERAVDVNRLRRYLVFQRVLRRLAADGTWVLKGGYALETRLGLGARATRDLDLTSLHDLDAKGLCSVLGAALTADIDGDRFVFSITGTRPHLLVTDGPGLHVSLTADLAEKPFATIRLDVVSRPEELGQAFEPLTLLPVVDVSPWPAVTVMAVEIAQHLAEKLHALALVASHPRQSTRVKDLLDVALVLGALTVDVDALSVRLFEVLHARNRHDPPPGLPDPPAAWRADYAALATELTAGVAPDYDEALAIARLVYAEAVGASGGSSGDSVRRDHPE